MSCAGWRGWRSTSAWTRSSPRAAGPPSSWRRWPSRGDAGARWLAEFEKARDPWFNVSTGDGFYHHHLSWNDDLTVPFTALPGYVAAVKAGTLKDRPTAHLQAERERIATGYRDLLASEEEKAAFDQMLGLCRLVFPFVEDHKFYCEHQFTTLFFRKVKEFGALLARQGVLAEADDIFHLHHTEVDLALADVMLAWAAGSPPLGGTRFPAIVAERKRMLAVLKDWSPPPALGPVPEALNDPAVRMLWGVTQERIEQWLHPSADEMRGVAASPGVVEGIARVLADVNEIGQLREGEILVCPVTAPSWAPVFGEDQGGGLRHRRGHVARGDRRPRVRHARRGRHRGRDQADPHRRQDPRGRRPRHRPGPGARGGTWLTLTRSSCRWRRHRAPPSPAGRARAWASSSGPESPSRRASW